MASSPPAPPADRLRQARWLVWFASALGAAALLLVLLGRPVADAVAPDRVRSVADRLALTRPVFEPAGQRSRAPASHAAIEPHFGPGLGALAPPPSALLLPATPAATP